MGVLLKKPQVKNVILALPGLVIGGLFSALGDWSNRDISFWIKVGLIIFFLFIYIFLLIYYSTGEVNDRRTRKILDDRVKTYEEIMTSIDNICKQNASEVNAVIHGIIEKGDFNPHVWSFDKACMLTCKHLYNLLVQLSSGDKDFGVAYVRLEEDQNPEVEIRMNGFANQNMLKPSIYNQRRRIDINNANDYHDVELFRKGKSDIEIIIGHEKIDEAFSYTQKQSRIDNKNKYNQYIAIPVFCDDTKMVGLLEIVCFNETNLGIDEREVKEIASKYFVPYSYLLLLLHKMEKAILAKPQSKVKS